MLYNHGNCWSKWDENTNVLTILLFWYFFLIICNKKQNKTKKRQLTEYCFLGYDSVPETIIQNGHWAEENIIKYLKIPSVPKNNVIILKLWFNGSIQTNPSILWIWMKQSSYGLNKFQGQKKQCIYKSL